MNALVLDNAIPVSMGEAARMLRESGGQFFRVDFIRRTDGAYRCMVARTGVKQHVTGAGARYDAGTHGLIRVWCATKLAYRSVPIEKIQGFKVKGVTYKVAS